VCVLCFFFVFVVCWKNERVFKVTREGCCCKSIVGVLLWLAVCAQRTDDPSAWVC